MMKLIGALIILLATIFFVYIKTTEKKSSLAFLDDFLVKIKLMADQIEYSGSTLGEVLCHITEDRGESKPFFEDVALILLKKENISVKSAWEMALDKVAEKYHLEQEIKKTIRQIGSHLGKMSIEIETENLKKSFSELSEKRKGQLDTFNKETKLLKSLALCFGFFIMLVLI